VVVGPPPAAHARSTCGGGRKRYSRHCGSFGYVFTYQEVNYRIWVQQTCPVTFSSSSPHRTVKVLSPFLVPSAAGMRVFLSSNVLVVVTGGNWRSRVRQSKETFLTMPVDGTPLLPCARHGPVAWPSRLLQPPHLNTWNSVEELFIENSTLDGTGPYTLPFATLSCQREVHDSLSTRTPVLSGPGLRLVRSIWVFPFQVEFCLET
jgi:hypothetical protein